ncbi:MAG TPA: bidirectional hydrogenase complex protein HoxE [Syntrophobacter fumaroxidans]|nr:bidirectional hydrogenase complex protein HoxE [Syntrophobacter fumaroxidans]
MPATSPKKADAPGGHPSGDPRYKGIDRVLKRQQYQQDALIEVLTSAQEAFGYLTEDVLIYTARQLKLPFSWVYGVATFYHFFSLKPQGEHSCIVCLGTACYVGKSNEIVEALEKEFNVKAGQTTEDGKLTVTTTRCLGCCGLAPVAVLDNQVLGKELPETTIAKVKAVLAGAPAAPSAAKPHTEEETASA